MFERGNYNHGRSLPPETIRPKPIEKSYKEVGQGQGLTSPSSLYVEKHHNGGNVVMKCIKSYNTVK